MNKIYVGSLAWATDNEGLRRAFEEFGEVVEAKVVMDRETGRSRGFGFVTFADEEGANRALSMDGQSLDGRALKVSVARERERRPGGFGGGGGGGFRGGGGGGNRRY